MTQALAQKTDSEELVTPVTARSNSTQIKGKQTNSDNSTKKPTKRKKKSFLLIGLAALILALLIFLNQRGPGKSESKDLADAKKVSGKAKITNRLPPVFRKRDEAEKIDPVRKKTNDKGLDCLVQQQKPNGRWQKKLIVRMRKNIGYVEQAYTGLALMNLLAKGTKLH